MQVEVRAVETFADLLFAVDSDDAPGSFYNRLCEAACTLAEMDRSVVFLYDSTRRRVRVVGSYGLSIEDFRDVHIQVDSAPMALRALSEDRVLEATSGFAELLPPEYERFLTDTRLVCTRFSAAGGGRGVILPDRAVDRPLTDGERHLLWSLGKIAALAASARVSTREQERARQLQERIDLAREIHDGVIQRLFGVSLALSGDELSPQARRRCADEIHEALTELRRAVQRPLGRASRSRSTSFANVVSVAGARRPSGRWSARRRSRSAACSSTVTRSRASAGSGASLETTSSTPNSRWITLSCTSRAKSIRSCSWRARACWNVAWRAASASADVLPSVHSR